MDAGRLDRRITILRDAPVNNSFNEPVSVWGDHAIVWAGFKPVSDGEKWASGQTLASAIVRFTVRWSSQVSDVDPRDRITFDGRTYDILGIKEVGRREYLEITAAARAETPA